MSPSDAKTYPDGMLKHRYAKVGQRRFHLRLDAEIWSALGEITEREGVKRAMYGHPPSVLKSTGVALQCLMELGTNKDEACARERGDTLRTVGREQPQRRAVIQRKGSLPHGRDQSPGARSA